MTYSVKNTSASNGRGREVRRAREKNCVNDTYTVKKGSKRRIRILNLVEKSQVME